MTTDLWLCRIDDDGTSHKLLAIHFIHCLFRIILRRHFNESITHGLTAGFLGDKADFSDRTEWFKSTSEIIFIDI